VNLKIFELSIHDLVSSKGWLLWTMALEGLGFSTVSTICSFDSITSQDEFKCAVFGDTFIMSQLGLWLTEHSHDGIIFIQGPQLYYNNVTKLIDNQYDHLPLVFVCSEPNIYSSDCQRISHHQVGGVLNASWSFYFENLCGVQIEKQSMFCVAHQIIDSVQGSAT
jgi:hypothetical protein